VRPRGVDLPDLAGARAVVTGGNSGVGLEIAQALAARGARVILPVRSPTKGEAALERIRSASPMADAELRELDLARLDSVRALAARLIAERHPLDILVLNAGIALLGDGTRHVTDDGFELHFQTNFLGHTILIRHLLSVLRASRTRVVVQGSLATALYGVEWADLQSTRRYMPLRAYGSSKTALGLFGAELGRRVPEIEVRLCHPGIVPATAIAPVLRDRVWPGLRDVVVRRLGNRPAQAAEPALLALTADAPAFCGPGGFLQFAGAARGRRPFRRLADAAQAARAWSLAEELDIAAPGS
jgi:NAD(P)-dependent dehydrogenase (short-subunit alcohol dehydrogenase family)